MKIRYIISFLLAASIAVCAVDAGAVKGVLATEEDIARLKRDLRQGKIKVGKTRLKTFRDNYGEAPSITDSRSRVVYDYNGLRVEFDKTKYWRRWDYDTFKDPVYTDDVDDLRFDLESGELVGENITYAKILKDYGDPTESVNRTEDGEISVFYYGDIKMVFQNVFTVRSWRGQLEDSTATQQQPSSGVLTGS